MQRNRTMMRGPAVVAAAVVIAATPFGPDRDRRALEVDDLRAALESRPLEQGVHRDDLDFFTKRLRQRPDDRLALQRLAGTSLLRFRSSGSEADLTRAEAVADALSARRPDDPVVLGLITSIALARHRFDAALDAALRRKDRSEVGAEGSALALFDALWAAGEYEQARVVLEGTALHHETSGSLARRARLLDGLGDVDRAVETMARAVEHVDAYAEPHVVRAWARVEAATFRFHSGDAPAAVDLYLEALELVPGYPAALEGLGGIAYGHDVDLGAAEELLRRSLDFGGHRDVLLALSEIARARGATERAASYRARFLALADSSGRVSRPYWRPLAMELADDPGTRLEAMRLAGADLRQRRDRGAWITRAWVLSRLGQHDAAVADAERGLAWGSPEPGVLYTAGRVFLAAGDERRARRLLRQAREGASELGPVVMERIAVMLDAM